MHREQIDQIVENRRGRFPILECEERFFEEFNQAPQPITYDELMRENFENTAAPLPVNFDDTMGQCGTDALAYYLPFHATNDWGIYILDAGVDILAEELVRISRINLPGGNNLVLSRVDAEYLAKHKLLLHELGHHATEIVHTALELDPNRPIRDSYRATRLPGRLAQNQRFHENEEAVCNWNVKRQPNKSEFKIRALDYFNPIENFMTTQPPGYNRFHEITNRNFLENIIDIRLTGVLPHQNQIQLEREFGQHSKLSRVKPRSTIGWNNPIGFVVPIYLIRT
jgi:hypothetical protein